MGLFAAGEIEPGTELTFNYQFETVGDVKKRCLCGARNCSGYIGEKPTSSSAAAVDGKENAGANGGRAGKRLRKPKAPKQAKNWEDLCFRCLEDGEVIMCDYKTCPKVYHLPCLGREKGISGKWFCPWHHCVTCGKNAVSYCRHCPNAYCKAHNSTLRRHPFLKLLCDEHDEDVEDMVAFYREAGGVDHLVPNPNVALEEVVPALRQNNSVLNSNAGNIAAAAADTSSTPTGQQEKAQRRSLVTPKPPRKNLNSSSSSARLGASSATTPKTTTATATPGGPTSSITTPRRPPPRREAPPPSSSTPKPPRSNLCKCIELDCAWIGKKESLLDHLVELHDLTVTSGKEKMQELFKSVSPRDERQMEKERQTGTTGASCSLRKSGCLDAAFDDGCVLKLWHERSNPIMVLLFQFELTS